MAIIKDIKELPKNEQKLKKYTIYALLICLFASIGFTALYLQRMTDADSEKPKKPKILVSTAHFLGYLALTVVTCLALYGTFYKKENFLIWFSIGSLLLVIGETLCLIWGLFMNSKPEDEDKKPSWWLILFTIIAILLFGISAVFTLLLKKFIPKTNPSTQPKTETKSENK